MFSTLTYSEPFDSSSHPSNFNRIAGIQLTTKIDYLPHRGRIFDDRLGWSETYWPSQKGGIAYRWNHPSPILFNYHLHSKNELLQMGQEELSFLSPAELYDISRDDYNYTLTKKVLSLYTLRDLWWEGICHGWAQASINYPEPTPIVYENKSGIKVPFGASDIKALLSMHEAYNYRGERFGFIGKRCRVKGKVEGEADERDHPSVRNYPPQDLAETLECRDVNAGSFHIVMSNMLGILGKGFVADIDRFNDIWNQPIVGYEFSYLTELTPTAQERSRGVNKVIKTHLKMTYSEELKFHTPELEAEGHLNFVSKEPVTLTPHQKFLTRDYEYFLEIDSRNKIIGGEWITSTRPDFMWLYLRSREFKNAPIPLAHLKEIYRPLSR